MTPVEVREVVTAELGADWPRSNPLGEYLRERLVTPRLVSCRNTFPQLDDARPLDLWIVFEEAPGKKDAYLIVFDERKRQFGLAVWDGDVPVFLGYDGSFLDTLDAM